MTAITATMNQWESSQDSPEVIVNENFKTLQWSSVYACNPDTTAGLTWGYYGGEYGGFTITAGTLTLTTATTNYIVVLRSTGVISTSTSITNWNDTAAYARVYLVTTGAATVSAVVDHRARTNGIFFVAGTFTGGTLTSALNEAPAATIASASTVNIGAASANTINVTGTTTITAFDSIADGAARRVVFSGALTLTYNATSLILPTAASIVTAAGDSAEFLSLGSGNWKCVQYLRADGTAVGTSGGIPQNSQSTAYTLVLSDANKHILHPSADTTARTFTIPANSSVAYPIGTAITFVNQNAAGTLTISITTDTMRLAGAGTTGSRTLAANGIATALKITSTEWIISGTGLT